MIQPPAAQQPHPPHPLRVLLVEDSENDALLIVRQLRLGGYDVSYERVCSAIGLKEALDRGGWELIVADYSMPGFNGMAALALVKRRAVELPFILVSGSIGEDLAVAAMKAGAHDYVMKNALGRLAPAVERELREATLRQERQQAARVQAATYRIAAAVSATANLDELYRAIHAILAELMPARSCYVAMIDAQHRLLRFPYWVDEREASPLVRPLRHGLTEYILRSGQPYLYSHQPELITQPSPDFEMVGTPAHDWLGVPLRLSGNGSGAPVGVLVVQTYAAGEHYTQADQQMLEFVAAQIGLAIARKGAEEALRESEQRYRALFEDSPISLWEEDISAMYEFVAELQQREIPDLEAYLRAHPAELLTNMRSVRVLDVNQATVHLFGASSKAELISRLSEVLEADASEVFLQELLAIARGQNEFSGLGYNRKLNGERVACVVQWKRLADRTQDAARVIVSVMDISERQQAEERLEREVRRMAGLRSVDMAITASMDLRVTLAVLLDQVTTQLQVDAADILLLNPQSQALEFAAGRGFKTGELARASILLGEGYAGQAALSRRPVLINDSQDCADLPQAPFLAREGFCAYLGIPLIAKGMLRGVLEVFQRHPQSSPPWDDAWMAYIETMAGQAAIAIESAQLFEHLQRSNEELARANDATIEGWSRALELRDEETEGHTQRVAELAVRLARRMGQSDDKLAHLRRGAILHDIGKMGISDAIFRKRGPLTPEEWQIMRRHPVYAYEWLAPVTYLRQALDIPYCHHEKWDGSGYPRGLAGENIPLAARIFAIVDVWDALLSDRPYRQAWPQAEVIAHLRQESGKHFDPQVVAAFLDLVATESEAEAAPAAV